MTLTGKQKRFLRARANRLRPEFHVGKNGINTTFLTQIDDSLARHELIKINLLQNTDLTPAAVAAELTSQIQDLEVPQIIGRVVLLYRPALKEKYRRLSLQVAAL
ncbi:YhbY family RNA-binding protein [Loigolactobacillus binensis]|uniref:YhbY family RNA-binding protein n=1 Tax=Loigolactobacillus binensis TaxID=2559922 RepID=A0ABW3E7I6_9LACO|nr:YhbY family RNA-binding protein [Loigolactobacillus binensis]